MRCCAFGTARIDIHVYQEFHGFNDYDEIKVDELSMEIGGSVCNTVNVLARLKQDVVIYMLNANDDLAEYVKTKLNKQGIDHIVCKQDKNDTATTIIFVDGEGNKKMVSYDGERQDKYILQKVYRDIEQYDIFYTSFYEINAQNYTGIIKIMSKIDKTFIDLSPLIYRVDKNVIVEILEHTTILSGTADEFEILMELIGVSSYKEIITKYKLDILLVKNGSKGAEMYKGNMIERYEPKVKKKSRDTTGCGDTFNAGIIYSLAKGENEVDMLKNAVEMATLVAYYGFNSEKICQFGD